MNVLTPEETIKLIKQHRVNSIVTVFYDKVIELINKEITRQSANKSLDADEVKFDLVIPLELEDEVKSDTALFNEVAEKIFNKVEQNLIDVGWKINNSVYGRYGTEVVLRFDMMIQSAP